MMKLIIPSWFGYRNHFRVAPESAESAKTSAGHVSMKNLSSKER